MNGRTWLLVASLAGCTGEIMGVDDPYDSEADADDQAQVAVVNALVAKNPDAPVVTADIASDDRDGDGIPDATEELLLRRYRPFYRFSQDNGHDETYRPADAVAEIEHAQLRTAYPGGGASDPIANCGRASDHHLDPADQLYTCGANTSMVVTNARTNYQLNLEDTRYGGVSFAEAEANATGFYGHVAPTTINGHAAYKIEYWQFFAFNNQDITVLGLGSFGDHEGDWTSVQLWFDLELHRLVKVRYLIHGKEADFTIPSMTPKCTDCTIDIQGSAYNTTDLPNFLDNQTPYSENEAEFYVDDHKFKHVVVYIERGAHEFWPGPWGHAEVNVGPVTLKLNPHNGAGPAYLVPDVQNRLFNMGEVDHPLTQAGKLIMWFNGFWGSTNTGKGTGLFGPPRRSPVGPSLHCSWRWPDGRAVPGCEH